MSYSLHQHKTSRGALEQAQGAGQTTVDAAQTYHSMTNGIPTGSAGHAALHSIAGGISAPLQFSAAIDIAQRQFGNRATLEFVRQQRAHHIARAGLSDADQSYPFLTEIQQSFGKHDISGLAGHTGAVARAANSELGSTAYHKGGHVAFGREPTLADAAHEAAHYVQGVGARQLEGGMGLPGDEYEQHADRVAAAVVGGESAEPLLDQSPGGGIPVVVTGNAPVQMNGGSRSKQKKPIPTVNMPPPLGVSRKYNPISSEMTAANERGVDLSNPRNRGELRTAGDIVGPLPGPAGHREFFYTISSQDRRVHGAMTEAHGLPGLFKLDKEGKFEDGIMIHRLRDDFVMENEEFALGPDGKKVPSKTTLATKAGWLSGGIETGAYSDRGLRSLAVGYNIEMVRAQQGLLQGAMGLYILPISNYDEMRRLFEMHLNPRDEDRVSSGDVNTDTGLMWLIDAANERNPVRSCLDLSNALLKRAKVVNTSGKWVDLGVKHPQRAIEHYRTLDRLNPEYYRFYDREDIAVRVAVHNNFLRRLLDPYAASDTIEDEYGEPMRKPLEAPPPRMPYPHTLNEGRGCIPKHNPFASFTNPDLLASYLSATALELPEHLGEVWENMPGDIRTGTAQALVHMYRELPKLREQRSRTENKKEKRMLDMRILLFEQVLERGGMDNIPEDIKLLFRKMTIPKSLL